MCVYLSVFFSACAYSYRATATATATATARPTGRPHNLVADHKNSLSSRDTLQTV